MKLHIFGSCAGTEPMPHRHHTSLAFEVNGRLYFFDAGENCSYTAHLMGLELRDTRAVFISHTHMDHVGGLGNLFWNIRKLTTLDNIQPKSDIDLYIPKPEVWAAIHTVLRNTEGDFRTAFAINPHRTEDGMIFSDENIGVEALHNYHLPHKEGDAWHSFSFRIRAEGKTFVYTGDVKSTEDVAPLLKDGCDAFLTETGHHSPDVAARYIVDHGCDVKKLIYIHNGGILLSDKAEGERLIKAVWDKDYIITDDAQTIEL